MTVLSRGAKNRRGGRRPGWLLLTALLVLAILASTTLVFTNRVELLRLAVILSLWAAVLAAFVSVIYRRQSQMDAAKARDMRFVYDLQLDREISARREYELSVEAHLRRQLAVEVRAQAADEMGALRAELATLRANLQALLGAELGDRPALESDRVSDAPLAMPPAPGRVHSSRVTTNAQGFGNQGFGNHAGLTAAEIKTAVITTAEITPVEVMAEVAVGPDSPIIDVPEEPLVSAGPTSPAAPPPPPAAPGRRRQAPPIDHQRPPAAERDRGSHRRAEMRDFGRPEATPRHPVPPQAAPAPETWSRRARPQEAPHVPAPPVPAAPIVPVAPEPAPPAPSTSWRPPETRTRPGRHRGFEEQAARHGGGDVPTTPEPPNWRAPAATARMGADPTVVPRPPVGRHSNASPDDSFGEAPGRHRNADALGEEAGPEAAPGQHSGGAPVADLVERLKSAPKPGGKGGGGGRRRRED